MKHDLTYTLRLLRRAPAFALAAVATLALGIGASTAMFSIIDTVVLRPLRFPEPERLVMLRPTSGARMSARLSRRMAPAESHVRRPRGMA